MGLALLQKLRDVTDGSAHTCMSPSGIPTTNLKMVEISSDHHPLLMLFDSLFKSICQTLVPMGLADAVVVQRCLQTVSGDHEASESGFEGVYHSGKTSENHW
jgi:hypothetical protein